MIAKRISKQSPRTSSMRRLVQYITSTQGTISRVGEVMITNCCESDDPQLAAIEMEAVQSLNKRSTVDKTYHLLVSFRAGEEPDEKALRTIEKEMCAALGYSEHQRIAVLHRDTDNTHMHIAINKVHPEIHTVHQPYLDFIKLRRARKKLEKQFSLSIDSGECREDMAANASKAQDMEAFSEMESLESWIRRECLEDMKTAETWEDFHNVLAENGLAILKRGNGMVFQSTAGDETVPVKASSIDRTFSKKKLEEKFGAFVPHDKAKTASIAVKKHYTKAPLPSVDQESLNLFAEYQRIRNANENRQSVELAMLDKEYARRSAAAKALHRAETKAIGTGGWSTAKKLQYETAKLKHRTAMTKLNQEIREKRKDVYVECGQCNWLDWLRSQAEAGREDAVEALRKRAYSLNKKFNAPSITGEKQDENAPVLDGESIDKVTKKGTVMYQVGEEIVRHDVDGYTVAKSSSIDTTAMALQMAARRFGRKLTVTGGLEFKSKVIAAAVDARLNITFSDKRMETERTRLLAERKEVQRHEQEQKRQEKKEGNER